MKLLFLFLQQRMDPSIYVRVRASYINKPESDRVWLQYIHIGSHGKTHWEIIHHWVHYNPQMTPSKTRDFRESRWVTKTSDDQEFFIIIHIFILLVFVVPCKLLQLPWRDGVERCHDVIAGPSEYDVITGVLPNVELEVSRIGLDIRPVHWQRPLEGRRWKLCSCRCSS